MVAIPPARLEPPAYLSVVAPLYNESENVEPLIAWILEALGDYPGPFEVILVDDGSRDDTWARVAAGARATHTCEVSAWLATSVRPRR